jgi:hypothetical protein
VSCRDGPEFRDTYVVEQWPCKALHGNPFDGHTLGSVVAAMERLTGIEVHPYPRRQGLPRPRLPNRFKVWISGQVRRVTKAMRREMRGRAAIEPMIGHLKAEHRMGRNYLKGRDGDRINGRLQRVLRIKNVRIPRSGLLQRNGARQAFETCIALWRYAARGTELV